MRGLIKASKALSDETRLRILMLLRKRECCVCEVMQALGISQSKASRALAILYDAGFLRMRKEGHWVLYSIDEEGMGRSLSLLLRAVAVEIGGSALVREDRRRLAGAVRVGVRCATRMQDVPRASRARA